MSVCLFQNITCDFFFSIKINKYEFATTRILDHVAIDIHRLEILNICLALSIDAI